MIVYNLAPLLRRDTRVIYAQQESSSQSRIAASPRGSAQCQLLHETVCWREAHLHVRHTTRAKQPIGLGDILLLLADGSSGRFEVVVKALQSISSSRTYNARLTFMIFPPVTAVSSK